MNEDLIIESMSEREKLTFLCSFIFLIKADNEVDNDEKELLREIISIYKLPVGALKDTNPKMSAEEIIADVKNNIKDRRLALFLIKELLVLANVDGKLDDTEIEFVISVAKALNVEEKKISQINSLLQEKRVWAFNYRIVMEQ